MKAEELMVGDWVYCTYPAINKCLRVAEIKTVADDELKVVLFDDIRLVFSENYISPIYITPEILAKNGFVIEKNDDVATRYSFATDLRKPKQTVIQFVFYDIEGFFPNTLFKCWTGAKDCSGINDLHICDLKFIHELQHALWLCGIDKEIEL